MQSCAGFCSRADGWSWVHAYRRSRTIGARFHAFDHIVFTRVPTPFGAVDAVLKDSLGQLRHPGQGVTGRRRCTSCGLPPPLPPRRSCGSALPDAECCSGSDDGYPAGGTSRPSSGRAACTAAGGASSGASPNFDAAPIAPRLLQSPSYFRRNRVHGLDWH